MAATLFGSYFEQHQNLLWLFTVVIDLGFAILLFRLYGRQVLYASIIISLLLANSQGPKLTMVFGLQTSMGVIVYSSIFFATDLLSERYGKREAQRAVVIGFFISILIIVMISLSLMYKPSPRPDTATYAKRVHEATQTLFVFTPRFILGSLLAYYSSQRLDVFLFHWIRERTGGRHLWLRNNASTMFSQAVDTIVYGVVVWGGGWWTSLPRCSWPRPNMYSNSSSPRWIRHSFIWLVPGMSADATGPDKHRRKNRCGPGHEYR